MSSSKKDEVKNFLSENPNRRYREISAATGLKISDVKLVINQNDNLFVKDFLGRWSLNSQLNTVKSDRTKIIPDKNSLIHIPAADVVSRIKSELIDNEVRKVSELSKKLELTRSVVRRTLEQYPEIFQKSGSLWLAKKDDDCNAIIDSSESIVSENSHDKNHNQEMDSGKPVQRTIIEAKHDKSFLVLAPPGTGKTYTLIERILNIITRFHGNAEPDEVLVLSFTRAAVNEVRSRISQAIDAGASRRLRYVRVKTFDSYATWLLSDGGYDLHGLGYDERIKLLTRELSKLQLKSSTHRIGKTRHLFVDEIQDLVGSRADMVFELIKRVLTASGSVTLLGDPNQTLNDYQVKTVTEGSAEFLKKVKKLLEINFEEYRLENSYRYENDVIKNIVWSAKKTIEEENISLSEKFELIKETIPKICAKELEKLVADRELDAILCRSNVDVFQWEKWLAERNIPCAINFGSLGNPWPSWIGHALVRYQQNIMPYSRLIDRINKVPFDEVMASELMESEGLIKNDKIDLNELAFKIKYSNPKLCEKKADPGIILSTIHKAKGLEYQNVAVYEPKIKKVTSEDVRILYVGLTRAKRSVRLIPVKERPFAGYVKPFYRSALTPKRVRYIKNGKQYAQLNGIDDFDLETLFLNSNGSIEKECLENYLVACREAHTFVIFPEKSFPENQHQYALYLKKNSGLIRICSTSKDVNACLDSLSWGGNFGEEGIRIIIGSDISYQTIVHPMQSPVLSRILGPSGIMVFPNLRGFYEIEKAEGD
jgi:hypothetical protein